MIEYIVPGNSELLLQLHGGQISFAVSLTTTPITSSIALLAISESLLKNLLESIDIELVKLSLKIILSSSLNKSIFSIRDLID